MISPTRELSSGHGPRVAVVAHAHPSVSKGGAEIAAYTLFQGLKKIGLAAIFIAACPERDKSRVSIGSGEHVIYHRPEDYDHFYHLGTPTQLIELKRVLVQETISVINFHHFFNFGFGAMRNLGMDAHLAKFFTFHEFLGICHHHGQMVTKPAQILCEAASPSSCSTCFPEHTRQQFALRKQLFLSTFDAFDGYVSPSQFLARRFIDWGLDPLRMKMIENGLASVPKRVLPQTTNKDHWTIGYFGQITPFKGVDILLKAAELLEKDKAIAGTISIRIHGNIVGQGTDFITQFTRSTQEGRTVSWLGPYENSSVARLMSDCDYVIVPSKWWENSPVVIQEAYAVGRPVICSGIGGMAEKIVDGQSGLHFRVNDAFDLVRVLKKAADVQTYNLLQAGVPSPHDAAEMARQYLEFFTSIERPLNQEAKSRAANVIAQS